MEGEARGKGLHREPGRAAAWARPGEPGKAAQEGPDPAAAWEVQVRLRGRGTRAEERTWAAQAHHGGVVEVHWAAERVQGVVEVLVRAERVLARDQAEEGDRVLSHTPVTA
ncbi:hypothetical protein [Nitrospira sp. Nam74]